MSGLAQGFGQDVRYSVRQLRRAPGFTLVAVLTLALGIGATTAIFTLVYQVILRSMPVAHPEQLYKLGKGDDCCVTGQGQESWNLFSYDLYKTLAAQTPGTDGVAAVSARKYVLSVRRAADTSNAQPLGVRFVSGNYFSLLGVGAGAGRLLQPADDVQGAAPMAVLSYTVWQTKFAGDPHLVGGTLMLAGHPLTVAGITAPGFLGERNETDPAGVWLTLAEEPAINPDENLLRLPGLNWLDLLVRIPLRGAVAPVQLAVQTELRRWLAAFPDPTAHLTDDQLRRATTELNSASGGINSLRGQYETNLHLLLLIAGFVLLIACANLANLLLVRGVARGSEISLRTALGAPRARLIRQTLVEALLLALAGGLCALPVAWGGTHAILALAFKDVEVNPLNAAPSLPVLGFALLVSVLTGVLFGIAPAWIASRSGPAEALRGANRSTGDSAALPQRLLVIFQAALSVALLSTAGLLITSLRNLEHQDFHFEPHGRLLVQTDLTAAGYTAARLPEVYQQLENTLASLPGVEHFAYATYGPMTGTNWGTGVWFPGGLAKARQSAYLAVSADYFGALGTHVLLGRGFTDADTSTSEHVAVVNQAFVRKYLAGKPPLGVHFGPDPALRNEFAIVGVVEDTAYGDPALPVSPMFFKNILQYTPFTNKQDQAVENAVHFAGDLVFTYRGSSSAAANQLRMALKSVNPDIPILQMQTYDDQLATNFTQQELVVRLTTIFGLLALLLAAVGLYGVTAYTVARRTGEIGVRMALGASRGSVLAMVLRGALLQTGIGLAIGVPLSLLAGRLLQHTLYQTGAVQPGVLATVIALLAAAAVLAALLPARRASSINPTEALRVS